ncbi:MAG: sugar ABC transporter permease [Sphaerochaeta sp.]|jgi:multiple sugar transport system permease protein|nr:sugar ABC transporter permease [Sphaerochaeta sp.]
MTFSRLEKRRNIWGYVFITPFLVMFVLFGLYPIIYTFQLSFQKWNGFSAVQNVGFQNWARLKDDGTFPLTLANTVKIWLWDFIPQLGIALLLSMIFTFRKIKGMSFFRAVFYLPNLITAASIGLLFNILFNGDKSTINQLLIRLGLKSQPIAFFKSGVITQGIASYILWWMWFGYTMILIMAGVTSIDSSLYEAAELDGCTSWQTFRLITMPLIRPTILYITITSIIGGMQIFDVPANLTNLAGDPQKAILTTSMYVYQQGFKNTSLGYASTLSVVQFLIIAALSFIALKMMRRKGA